MAEYKQVDLQIGTEAQFESKKETLPIGTIVGITDPIDKSDLDSDLLASIDSIADKLDKPSGNPTEDSLIKVSSTGSTSYQKLSELASSTDLNSKLNKPGTPTEDSVVTLTNTGVVGTKKLSDLASAVTAATMKYTAITIPWANVAANGFTDTVRQIGSIYEHSLYIRLTYEDWNAEVFLTVISTESSQITSSSALSTLLGSTYYHEASGTIHQTVDSTNFYLGQIQNVSHNGVKVLIPV